MFLRVTVLPRRAPIYVYHGAKLQYCTKILEQSSTTPSANTAQKERTLYMLHNLT
jgi:hypothetical protein